MWEYKIEHISLTIFNEDGTVGDNQKLIFDETDSFYHHQRYEKELVEQLNKHGKQGWEVVFIPEELMTGESDFAYVLFKRTVRAEGK